MHAYDLQEREIDLLRKIAEGDQQSFSALYDRFADVLYATAWTVTRKHEVAEEVVQDVFVQIWLKASTYNSQRGRPLGWAITLTRNRAIDRIRSAGRQSRLLEQIQQDRLPDDDRFEGSSFHHAIAAESSLLVGMALKELPVGQRRAIEMVFLQGWTMSEAASKLGEHLPTIKGRVRRGLLRLHELLKRRI